MHYVTLKTIAYLHRECQGLAPVKKTDETRPAKPMDAYLSKGTNPQILPQYELTDLNRSLLHCGALLDEVSKYDLNDLDVFVRRREDLCAGDAAL